MTDITIPPEAVEAAKAAYTAEIYKGQGTATEYTAAMRAACIAMLRSWPGAYGNGPRKQWKHYTPAIILPLTEDTNAEG